MFSPKSPPVFGSKPAFSKSLFFFYFFLFLPGYVFREVASKVAMDGSVREANGLLPWNKMCDWPMKAALIREVLVRAVGGEAIIIR